MPRRLLFALLVLVAAPLALLGWLSASTYRQQQETARERLEMFFQSRLAEIDVSLTAVIDNYDRDLSTALSRSGDLMQSLRSLDRDNPIVRASMFVNSSGVLIYPPRPTSDSSEQISLYASLPAIIGSRPDLPRSDLIEEKISVAPVKSEASFSTRQAVANALTKSAPSKSVADKQSSSSQSSERNVVADSPARTVRAGRWQVWYMDEGIQLIRWMPRSDGAAVGVLLERARWVADLTAALPDMAPLSTPTRSKSDSTEASGFTVLADETNRIVYRWGDAAPRVNPPLATRSLSWPLTSWRLEYHSDDPLAASAATALVASLAGIGVVLLALGVYVLTGVQRQMRAARSRVSFASQVSHELRTPLTNIRLYAELAESDLEQLPEGKARSSIEKRLEVINSESRRLSRLVSGVLEMIRDTTKKQGPRIAPVIPDQVIDQALIQFSPSFQNAELTLNRDAKASRLVGLDADILEMILVNLLSNVEKYARDGDRLDVSSWLDGAELFVRVADRGPGISWRHRRSVFRPFARLDDSISAPSGTGIGLTIARRLARRHGGDLRLVESDHGACFEFRLAIQKTNQARPVAEEQPE